TAFIPPEDDNNSLDKAEKFEIVPATTKKSRKQRKTKKGKSTCTTITKETTPIHLSIHSPTHSPAYSYISNIQQKDSQQSAPTYDNLNIPSLSQIIPQQNPSSEDAGHHDES
ncbi:5312_t:CDS:2, partial [Dentiscutata heterogama]